VNAWVPIVVASIGIIPGILAFWAARSVKTEVTTNHGKRLGEYVELIAERMDLLETKMDVQHGQIFNRVDSLADDLKKHMDAEEERQRASEEAVRAVLTRGNPHRSKHKRVA
jgi:hypothetical protein